MNRDALVASVKKNYAKADEATIDAVIKTLQDANGDWRLPEQPSAAVKTVQTSGKDSTPLEFAGEHMTLEQYRQLSLSERGEHKRRLKAQNREWLEAKYAALRAAWIMVMDGEVIAYGTSLQDYPSTEKIREIGGRFGKRPFIFINDLFVAIEESKTPWHATIYERDFYPTVPIIEVKLPSGESLSRKLLLNCVINWRFSPFVSITSHRTALAGRDLFLELQPSILLDFANRSTRLVTSEQV